MSIRPIPFLCSRLSVAIFILRLVLQFIWWNGMVRLLRQNDGNFCNNMRFVLPRAPYSWYHKHTFRSLFCVGRPGNIKRYDLHKNLVRNILVHKSKLKLFPLEFSSIYLADLVEQDKEKRQNSKDRLLAFYRKQPNCIMSRLHREEYLHNINREQLQTVFSKT